jgi:hypothetical protein
VCIKTNSDLATVLLLCMLIKGFSAVLFPIKWYFAGSIMGSPILFEIKLPKVSFAFLQEFIVIDLTLPTSARSWPKKSKNKILAYGKSGS